MQPLFAGLPQEGAILGDEEAPVTVTVFNDLQCAGCDDFQFDVVDPLIEANVRQSDEVRLEFRHRSLAPNSTTVSAIAAEAAGLQGYQWQFIDTFFRNQDVFRSREIDADLLREVAEATGEIDLDVWQEDYDDPATEDLVIQDDMLAEELELPKGPAVVVSGPNGQQELISETDDAADWPTRDEVETAIAQVD